MFKKYTIHTLFAVLVALFSIVITPSIGRALPYSGAIGIPSNSYLASTDCSKDSNCLSDKYINPAINFLGIGFGIIVIIMLVIGGLQYGTSAGDPQQVANAKKRIRNAILALVAFAFMYAFLQWLVPGGIF